MCLNAEAELLKRHRLNWDAIHHQAIETTHSVPKDNWVPDSKRPLDHWGQSWGSSGGLLGAELGVYWGRSWGSTGGRAGGHLGAELGDHWPFAHQFSGSPLVSLSPHPTASPLHVFINLHLNRHYQCVTLHVFINLHFFINIWIDITSA